MKLCGQSSNEYVDENSTLYFRFKTRLPATLLARGLPALLLTITCTKTLPQGVSAKASTSDRASSFVACNDARLSRRCATFPLLASARPEDAGNYGRKYQARTIKKITNLRLLQG
jgi:hypothetical protein